MRQNVLSPDGKPIYLNYYVSFTSIMFEKTNFTSSTQSIRVNLIILFSGGMKLMLFSTASI